MSDKKFVFKAQVLPWAFLLVPCLLWPQRTGVDGNIRSDDRQRLPGMVEIALTPHPAISQQHGFVHGGAVSAIADTAAGYAALSLMPADTGVLTTEFKINLLAPAAGERIFVDAW